MLKDKISKMLPHLNEKQKRIYLALEAEDLGHGGVKKVSEASSVSRKTIINGKKEIAESEANIEDEVNQESEVDIFRIRKPGGGRKSLNEIDPGLFSALETLLEPVTRGHPETVLKWTCLSTRSLSEALKKMGYSVSHTKVGEMLKEAGFSLQANSKTLEGGNHPDRNEQFMYINTKTEKYIKNGYPAISVDTKKKELVGEYKNGGKELRPKKNPRPVVNTRASAYCL